MALASSLQPYAQLIDMETNTDRKGNSIWAILASVKLAVFLLITLAITSIIGTLIPQGETDQFYLEKYGQDFFKIITTLRLNDTYHAWWFTSLLLLFSINLIVCTIKRFPITLKIFKRDNLSCDIDYLSRFQLKKEWELGSEPQNSAVNAIVEAFKHAAGKPEEREKEDGGRLYLVEKGKWSYWGIYGLHSSIIIIFIGALIGLFWGFKGYVELFEGETTGQVINRSTFGEIPLGFDVRCDKFTVDFYDNGAPKEYVSDITILENDKEMLHKSIRVNSPLTYKGITFYQASYNSIPEVNLHIISPDGRQGSLTVPAMGKVAWPEGKLSIGIIQYLPSIHGEPAAQVWIASPNGDVDTLWLLKGHEKELNIGSNAYKIAMVDAKNRYMTGLQVKKDPGVWIVWLGCTALILSFIVVFWVAHTRLWLWIGSKNGNITVLLAGQTNKNQLAFEKDFIKIREAIDKAIGDKA
ncbi:MAG: cytochrome c biogenesis protein ResB [Dissulfurimicrobium sp.]|uniref:cytochrome c biogenesis protein ResB n=1 Tax=Dissulfurimicrobium sp. TaxID=2022436 RepID=UPI00404B0896